ncbi:hypothetical protein [Hyphomonas sp.]|uniref:hypothetical protein n=1 Tax=Hyphomonas sp. TaxID=87 RepID=UPI0030F55562
MKLIGFGFIVLTFLCFGHASARESPAERFENTKAAVIKDFKCLDTGLEEAGKLWVCNTKINLGNNEGQADLKIGLFYESAAPIYGALTYIFEVKNADMIRETSFRGLKGLAAFISEDAAKTLSTKDNYADYLRGKNNFITNDLIFQISDFGNLQITVFDRSLFEKTIKPIQEGDFDTENCNSTNGVPGWQVRWSHNDATLWPVLKSTSRTEGTFRGRFSIGKNGQVALKFSPKPLRNHKDEYVILFVDEIPIYRGQFSKGTNSWSSGVLDAELDTKTLFKMASGTIGTLLMSSDPAGANVTNAVTFDLKNIDKAANMAIGGRFEKSLHKDQGMCR